MACNPIQSSNLNFLQSNKSLDELISCLRQANALGKDHPIQLMKIDPSLYPVLQKIVNTLLERAPSFLTEATMDSLIANSKLWASFQEGLLRWHKNPELFVEQNLKVLLENMECAEEFSFVFRFCSPILEQVRPLLAQHPEQIESFFLQFIHPRQQQPSAELEPLIKTLRENGFLTLGLLQAILKNQPQAADFMKAFCLLLETGHLSNFSPQEIEHLAAYLYLEDASKTLTLLNEVNYLRECQSEEIKDFLYNPKADWKLRALLIALKQTPEIKPPPEALLGVLSQQPTSSLTEEHINIIEPYAARLSNRALKGKACFSLQEVLASAPSEIDLARGVLIVHQDCDPMTIRKYEAAIDLMALQISSRLTAGATAAEKIQEINRYLFEDLQIRFSLHQDRIEEETLLTSIIDRRAGLCEGLSIFYISIAQRLGLTLEFVRVPGHVYPRHVNENGEITNIETTEKGINRPYPAKASHLESLNLRETIGRFVNNLEIAARLRKDFLSSVKLLEKGLLFFPENPSLLARLGLSYLLLGREAPARHAFEQATNHSRIDESNRAAFDIEMAEDYLAGKINREGICLCLDETPSTEALESVVLNYPDFFTAKVLLAGKYFNNSQIQKACEISKHSMNFSFTRLELKYQKVHESMDLASPNEGTRQLIADKFRAIQERMNLIQTSIQTFDPALQEFWNAPSAIESIGASMNDCLGNLAELYDLVAKSKP